MDELFSLEDDDLSQFFITQESRGETSEIVDKSAESGNLFLGKDVNDLTSPVMSVIQKRNMPVYSDISDDDFPIEPSQKRPKLR